MLEWKIKNNVNIITTRNKETRYKNMYEVGDQIKL